LRRVLAAATVTALAAFACGVVTLQPDPIAPVNECTDDPGCAKIFVEAGLGSCNGGACSTTGFVPFVVVAVPQDQANIGSSTIALPSNYASVRGTLAQKGGLPPSPLCLSAQQNAPTTECDPIPPLATFANGTLQIDVGFDSTLYPGGLRPNNPATLGAVTFMPVNISVEMLWKDPATGTFAPARKLGIALDDIVGFLQTLPVATAGPTNSDATVPGFAFGAKVPQPLSPDSVNALAYRMHLVPPNPYASIPPITLPPITALLLQPGFQPVSQALPTIAYKTPVTDGGTMQAHTYQINEAPSAPSLEGWTAHIDDQNGYRVSGTIVLPAGASKSVTLYEATSVQSQGGDPTPGPDRYVETLYLDPPKGSTLPRFFAEAKGSIVGPFTYPALPCIVALSGRVLTSDTLQPASAQVEFVANGKTNSLFEADLTTSAPLLFSAKTTTISDGQYIIDVYPGTPRVYVVPDDPDLALTTFDKPISGLSCTVNAQSLFVNRRTHVKGRVLLPNGTPVFAADVIISASADSPFLPKDDPLARPREVRGTTDTNGLFDLPSDPGFVDISIRPRDTTNFPWVVLTNRVVPPNDGTDAGTLVTLNVSDVVIPEPSRYTQTAAGVLTDSVGNPIVHAIVRAYAFPPSATGVDGGAPQTRGARLLGMTVTDESAKFQLFVVPPQ
jgi:hypothetical protein